MLRIEFEQNLAANEQTGPINKEMRNLISSLQTHNMQLKGEVARYKRKFKESNMEISKLRRDLDEMRTAEIKALQAKKLEREERMMSEEHTDDSSGCGTGAGNHSGFGDNANSGQINLLTTEDHLVSQDSCSEGSPNGLLKV
jgi:E3 ubiquitin-protein ligase BRE1